MNAIIERRNPGTVRVIFETDNNSGRTLPIERVNHAFRQATEEERYTLTMSLLTLWLSADFREGEFRDQAKTVFGKLFELHDDLFRRLIYTVTADGRQLRVWYGLPGRMEPSHVDSCGKNLLFTVEGHSEVVQKYLQGLLELCPRLKEIKVPNGVRLFMEWNWK